MNAGVKPLGLRRGLLSIGSWNGIALLALSSVVLLPSLGCTFGKGEKWKFASLDMQKAKFWDRDGKPDPETPARFATTWTEATLTRAGQPPQRGFGGRLLFYQKEAAEPVRVEGQLVIYAFDETNGDPLTAEPTRRYVFPADQLALYESESTLGPSYSVWVPWDNAGGSETKVSLIARFEPKEGGVVVGEQTHHYLAGPPARGNLADERSIVSGTTSSQQAQRVTAASYNGGPVHVGLPSTTAAAQTIEPASMSTTTIALPRKLSAAPGGPLRTGRAAAAGQMFTTPHMSGVSAPGLPAHALPAEAAPIPSGQQAPAPAATNTGPVTTAGYLSPLGAPATLTTPGMPLPGMPQSGGYQWPQRPAPGQPVGR
jgi:hypothetical protein